MLDPVGAYKEYRKDTTVQVDKDRFSTQRSAEGHGAPRCDGRTTEGTDSIRRQKNKLFRESAIAEYLGKTVAEIAQQGDQTAKQGKLERYKAYIDALAEAKEDNAITATLLLIKLPAELLSSIADYLVLSSERSSCRRRFLKHKTVQIIGHLLTVLIDGEIVSVTEKMESIIEEAIVRSKTMCFRPRYRKPAKPDRRPYPKELRPYVQHVWSLKLIVRVERP